MKNDLPPVEVSSFATITTIISPAFNPTEAYIRSESNYSSNRLHATTGDGVSVFYFPF